MHGKYAIKIGGKLGPGAGVGTYSVIQRRRLVKSNTVIIKNNICTVTLK